MAAFKEAVAAGVSPVEFWSLTPYLTQTAAGALLQSRLWSLWMGEALHRTKRLPKLKKFITVNKDERVSDLKSFLAGKGKK